MGSHLGARRATGNGARRRYGEHRDRFSVLAVGLARWGRLYGIAPADWGYRLSLRGVGAALAGAVGHLIAAGALSAVYARFGDPSAAANALLTASSAAPAWALGALVVVNGVFVPTVEELAWRGVIQTALMERHGAVVGGAITAAGFVAKHAVADLGASPVRFASLVLLAALLCLLRARYGTASSTVAHVAVNPLSSAALAATALGVIPT